MRKILILCFEYNGLFLVVLANLRYWSVHVFLRNAVIVSASQLWYVSAVEAFSFFACVDWLGETGGTGTGEYLLPNYGLSVEKFSKPLIKMSCQTDHLERVWDAAAEQHHMINVELNKWGLLKLVAFELSDSGPGLMSWSCRLCKINGICGHHLP